LVDAEGELMKLKSQQANY